MELIRRQVSHFSQKEFFDDDLTLLIFRIQDNCAYEDHISQNRAKFNSDLTQLKAVRKFVEAFCTKVMDGSSALSTQLGLIADEIVTNIIRHGYKGESGHEVIIQADLTQDSVLFEIFDQGDPFDPREIVHPNLSGEQEGGFGFYLVKEIADKVSYERRKSENGWNCIRITKAIRYRGNQMDISHHKIGNVIVIKLEGENLDAQEAPDFKQKANDLISKEGSNHVVLDLSGLNFIDSTGLGSFLSLMRGLNSSQGDMKLANMSSPIHTIFELVCMHKIFEIYDSVEEAVAAFEKQKA